MAKRDQKAELDVGARLRSARLARRLSQRELARRSGVTNGMISQIEQNNSSPSVSSLKRILEAIPMSLSEFFSTHEQGPKVFYLASEMRELTPPALLPLDRKAAQMLSFRQVGNGGQHSIQMLHERYAPGADTGEEPYAHMGEEAGIVVEGSIEVTVGDQTQVLNAGDAYIFDSALPHRFRNLGETDCVIISACTPPTF